jgi:hypothetical protein
VAVDSFETTRTSGNPISKDQPMFPFWCEMSGSQLLQWISGGMVLLVCLVNLAAGQRHGC